MVKILILVSTQIFLVHEVSRLHLLGPAELYPSEKKNIDVQICHNKSDWSHETSRFRELVLWHRQSTRFDQGLYDSWGVYEVLDQFLPVGQTEMSDQLVSASMSCSSRELQREERRENCLMLTLLVASVIPTSSAIYLPWEDWPQTGIHTHIKVAND